jgi:LuxR family maltose regulon positive regulatory protein
MVAIGSCQERREFTFMAPKVSLLTVAGDSNHAIADQLVITVRTVKKHTSNIYGKLNVGSRTQAVAYARELGLLPTD